MNNEWLQQLKVGDEVFTKQEGRVLGPYKINRLTQTLIILQKINIVGGFYEKKYNRCSGRQQGGESYRSEWLVQDTPDTRRQCELNAKFRKAVSMRDAIVIPRYSEGLDQFIAAITPFVQAAQ